LTIAKIAFRNACGNVRHFTITCRNPASSSFFSLTAPDFAPMF
jgi:hypothetical protein